MSGQFTLSPVTTRGRETAAAFFFVCNVHYCVVIFSSAKGAEAMRRRVRQVDSVWIRLQAVAALAGVPLAVLLEMRGADVQARLTP